MKNVWKETGPRHNSAPQTQDQDTIMYPDTNKYNVLNCKIKIWIYIYINVMFKLINLLNKKWIYFEKNNNILYI